MHLPIPLHRHPRARRAHGDGVLRERLSRLRIVNRTRATTLATECRTADSILSRGLGLLARSSLGAGEGLRITHTNAITMFFMRFAIDVVFVDRARRVVLARERVRPWVPWVVARRADEVLELPSGTIARTLTQAGDELQYEPA
jgi:uncharacterized membrane protein (UPF0127 family)